MNMHDTDRILKSAGYIPADGILLSMNRVRLSRTAGGDLRK